MAVDEGNSHPAREAPEASPGIHGDLFHDLLDEATSSLRDDTELRLDVRAELASHLEDKRDDFAAKGHSSDEALDLARQSFGPPDTVARDLLAANRRRMKLRALARLALRAAVVPAGILACVLVIATTAARFGSLGFTYGWLAGGDHLPVGSEPPVFEGLPEESRLVLLGDPTRATEAERQRAIWEAHPEDMTFFGNYITALAAGKSAWEEPETFEGELRRGMELDPGNARYRFLLASHHLGAAAEEDWPEDGEHELVVKDRALLDRAMAEYVKACRMPRLDTYTRKMLSRRLKLLPPEAGVEDRILRQSMAGSVLLPDLARHRLLARVVPRYAELLVAEGRNDEAREVLDSWFGQVSLLAGDSWTLIELLVLNAVLGMVREGHAEIYRELGDGDAAEKTSRLVRRIEAPLKAYRETVNPESAGAATDAEREEFKRRLRRSGGLLVQILMPALGDAWRSLDPDAFAPGAQLEHTLLEEAGLVIALALVLLAMLVALLVAIRWRASLGPESRPLLVLPSWQDTARILGLGVIVPLACFLVYTRWSGLAGREFALTYLPLRFAMEVVLLVVTIMYLTVSLGSAFVRRRLLDMGEEAPAEARTRRIVSGAGLASLWAAWIFVRGEASAMAVGIVEMNVVGLALIAVLVVGAMRLFLSRNRRHGRFYGSAARSLLPILAAAAVLIALLAYPYLRARERDLLRRDELMAVDPDDPSFTRLERDLVRRLRGEVRQAVEEAKTEAARDR
jgi:hypothetical protein